MLRQTLHELELRTRGRGFHEITERVQELVRESGLKTGLATLHLLGLDHERLTFYHNGIERRLTDVHGQVIEAVLS